MRSDGITALLPGSFAAVLQGPATDMSSWRQATSAAIHPQQKRAAQHVLRAANIFCKACVKAQEQPFSSEVAGNVASSRNALIEAVKQSSRVVPHMFDALLARTFF